MVILGAILFVLFLLVCLIMTVLGLPGNWVMVVAAAIYAYAMPPETKADFGWPIVLTLVLVAALGEVIEFVAGALGVARGGGSRRGALMALAGSMVGALAGMVVGMPVPVIGPLLAALLFAGLGALIGAMIGEHSAGRSLGEAWRIGKAAFWGRLLGTLAKTIIGAIMLVIATIAVLV